MKQENPESVQGGKAVEMADKADTAAERGKFDGAKWATSKRSMASGGYRSDRSNKCPSAIAQRIRAANPQTAREWFQLYCDCETDWATVELTIKTLEKDQRSDVSELEWYTRDDLMEKHHGNDKIVDSIVKQKGRDDSSWRPHPDAPEEDEATQYL